MKLYRFDRDKFLDLYSVVYIKVWEISSMDSSKSSQLKK